jgi:hypothetical protein
MRAEAREGLIKNQTSSLILHPSALILGDSSLISYINSRSDKR